MIKNIVDHVAIVYLVGWLVLVILAGTPHPARCPVCASRRRIQAVRLRWLMPQRRGTRWH